MELRVLLIAALAAVLPMGLARVLRAGGVSSEKGGACRPERDAWRQRLAGAGPILGAAIAARFALHGAWPGWPPHDAGEVLAWCTGGMLASLVLPVLGWVTPVLLWAAFALEPYWSHHWVESLPWLRTAGVAGAALLLGAAFQRGLGGGAGGTAWGADDGFGSRTLVLARERAGLGGVFLGAALLLGNSTGSGALTLGALGLALASVTVDQALPGGERAWHGAALLGALACAIVVQAVLYASVPAGPAALLGCAAALLAWGPPSGGLMFLRSGVMLAATGLAVWWGWPEPDPYAGGW